MNEGKKILIVEDNEGVFKMMEKELDSSTFFVKRARAVDEAVGALGKYGPFDCIVVDLQILAMGLTLEQMEKYQDREGYAFLKEFLWKGGKDEEVKELKSKTIICSRYVSGFKKEYRNEMDGLTLVDKTPGFEKEVTSLIKKICL